MKLGRTFCSLILIAQLPNAKIKPQSLMASYFQEANQKAIKEINEQHEPIDAKWLVEYLTDSDWQGKIDDLSYYINTFSNASAVDYWKEQREDYIALQDKKYELLHRIMKYGRAKVIREEQKYLNKLQKYLNEKRREERGERLFEIQ